MAFLLFSPGARDMGVLYTWQDGKTISKNTDNSVHSRVSVVFPLVTWWMELWLAATAQHHGRGLYCIWLTQEKIVQFLPNAYHFWTIFKLKNAKLNNLKSGTLGISCLFHLCTFISLLALPICFCLLYQHSCQACFWYLLCLFKLCFCFFGILCNFFFLDSHIYWLW